MRLQWRIPFRRRKNKWEDNTKINLKEIECEGVVWIYQIRDSDRPLLER
jgi:hypothetical protein